MKIISLKSLEKKFSFSDSINLKNISLSSPDELKKFLENLEYGKIRKENYNIINFFERDFFGWYNKKTDWREKWTKFGIEEYCLSDIRIKWIF